jgi:hypothetical protein
MNFSKFEIPEGGLPEVDCLPAGWVRNALIRIRYRYAEVPSVGMLPVEDRQNWVGPIFLKGSQWHVLGSDIFDLIVERQSEMCQIFRDLCSPEEHAFQWAVSQTPASRELRLGNHVAMHWEGASPRRLSFPEAREIAATGRFLFARKAQRGCAVEDWIAWAHDNLKNAVGARWLRDTSAGFRAIALGSVASDRSVQGERLCSHLLGSLVLELSAALVSRMKLEKRSDRRYLIDSGPCLPRGGHVFFLCFAEPSLGILVVPALRQTDLGEDDPMRLRPSPRFFPGFVNLPIGGRVGWSIGSTDTLADCKEFADSILTQVQ